MEASLAESERRGVCAKPQPIAGPIQEARLERRKTDDKSDKQDWRDNDRQIRRAAAWCESGAGFLAALHLAGRQIMLDPVSDDAELQNQQYQRQASPKPAIPIREKSTRSIHDR
jgi:hypothetical protein